MNTLRECDSIHEPEGLEYSEETYIHETNTVLTFTG